MAADFVVRYNSFLGGDWGNVDPGRASDNEYRGTNVRLYDSELLGPRPGLKKLNVTGLPTHPSRSTPWGFDHWHNEIVIVLDQPWRFVIPASADEETTAFTPGAFSTGTPKEHTRTAQFAGNIYFNHDGVIQKLDYESNELSQISVPAPIKGLTRWNYYLIGWDKTNPQRLFYSDVGEAGANPDSWQTNNFLDVGGNEPITGLFPMYNYLWVAKQSGWYAVSGVLADRPYVRRVANGNGPKDDRQCAITTDNRILAWGPTNVPVWFNGENPYMDSNYRVESLETNYPCDAVVASPTGRHCFMLGEPLNSYESEDSATGLLEYDNGRWSTHDFRLKAMGGIAGHDLRTAIDKPPGIMFFASRARNLGDPVEIWSFPVRSQRVQHQDDLWSSPSEAGDGLLIDGAVELPAFYDSQSRMILVRNVIVQFRHWPSGLDSSINELQCQVRPMGTFEGGAIEVEPQVWTQRSERAHPNGSDQTWRMGWGKYGWSNGFQIVFPKLRGVALRSIEAHVEVRTARV